MESFEELAIRDEELRLAAIADSQSEYEVVPPDSYDPEKSYPAIFILHGGGSNLLRARKHWNSVDLNRNFILVFIQSYLHYDYNTFGWKRYDPRARQDIINCFSEVLGDYKILPEEVAIAGISAGATMALDVFLNNIIPVKACIVFSPSRPTEFLSENMLSEEFKNKTAVMLIGENDSESRKSDFIEMAEAMTKAGIHTPITIMPDTGHEYPIDFPLWVRSSLEIIYPEIISQHHESSSHH
jgi:dipeptidyl aminopeptidase/acylaminoacyl peptidase